MDHPEASSLHSNILNPLLEAADDVRKFKESLVRTDLLDVVRFKGTPMRESLDILSMLVPGEVILEEQQRRDAEMREFVEQSTKGITEQFEKLIAGRAGSTEPHPLSSRDRESIAAESEGSEVGSETQIFRKEGKTWRVVYGGKSVSVLHTAGMEYLAHLLQSPSQEIYALDLRALRAGVADPPPSGSAGALLDEKAIKSYKLRAQVIEEELADAERNNDIGRVAKLKEEHQTLCSEVSRAVGLHGRGRRGADDSERARQAVSAAVHRAIRAISKEHPKLGQHLTNSLRLGLLSSYEPDRLVRWLM